MVVSVRATAMPALTFLTVNVTVRADKSTADNGNGKRPSAVTLRLQPPGLCRAAQPCAVAPIPI